MKTEDLAGIPIFAALSSEEQGRVAGVSRAVRFAEGTLVVNQGEFAFDFYAITHGAADVIRSGERVAALGSGDVFGELGVVAGSGQRWTRRRGASVLVTAPMDAIAIDGSEFRRLTDEIPALRNAIDTMVAERRLPADA